MGEQAYLCHSLFIRIKWVLNGLDVVKILWEYRQFCVEKARTGNSLCPAEVL